MARVFLVKSSQSMRHVYTVEKSVGYGGVNSRDDVLLVQFFLKVAMLDSANSKGYKPPGEQPISVDGNCGPQTCRYIKYYQEEGNRRNPGAKTTTEGRVDPIASGAVFSSISQTFYTILALNVSYKERRGKEMHEDISKDQDFPAELAKSLYV